MKTRLFQSDMGEKQEILNNFFSFFSFKSLIKVGKCFVSLFLQPKVHQSFPILTLCLNVVADLLDKEGHGRALPLDDVLQRHPEVTGGGGQRPLLGDGRTEDLLHTVHDRLAAHLLALWKRNRELVKERL